MNILIVDKQAYLFSDYTSDLKYIETTKPYQDFDSYESGALIRKFNLLTYLREFAQDHVYTIQVYLNSRLVATDKARLIYYKIDNHSINRQSEAEFLIIPQK